MQFMHEGHGSHEGCMWDMQRRTTGALAESTTLLATLLTRFSTWAFPTHQQVRIPNTHLEQLKAEANPG